MKKFSLFVCAVFLILPSLIFTACGSSRAKITGIIAGIGTEQIPPMVYGNPLLDDETNAEDDYILQVGQNYIFGVAYAQTGGSILALISTDKIKLKYDKEVLKITPPEEKEGEFVRYNLTCLKTAVNTAVIVEVGKYSYTVVISAV